MRSERSEGADAAAAAAHAHREDLHLPRVGDLRLRCRPPVAALGDEERADEDAETRGLRSSRSDDVHDVEVLARGTVAELALSIGEVHPRTRDRDEEVS